MKAIQIEEFGGPEVLEVVELPDPEPGEGEVVVEVARAGINFADTHATRNDYLAEQTPAADPGRRGRRHARRTGAGSPRSSPPAATPRRSRCPRHALVPIPDEVDDDQAAALLLQGLTAHAWSTAARTLEAGETVVVEAAAGGTGTLAVQLAKRAGGRVIALASTRGEARARRAARRRRRGRLARRGPRRRRSSRPTAASRSTSSSRWPAAEPSSAELARARPVRAARRLRDRLARAATRSARADLMRQLAVGDRLLARALLGRRDDWSRR